MQPITDKPKTWKWRKSTIIHFNLVTFDYTLKQVSLNNRTRLQATDHFQTCICKFRTHNIVALAKECRKWSTDKTTAFTTLPMLRYCTHVDVKRMA